MPVAKHIAKQLERSSWIRRMFEEGTRLRKELGPDRVYDFTLGNPEVEPPAELLAALRRVVERGTPGSHGYMPNPGFPQVRAAIAAKLRADTGQPFEADHVLMTVGAAGACNIVLKAILDAGDEVILLAPFFAEYPFYIGNHGGQVVTVETRADFLPDVERIAAAITPRTRAILLNTPNNPSGRVYPAEVLADLQAMLGRLPNPPLVISDEPYKALVYDGKKQTEVASVISQVAICSSWSKQQALAGERIGYLALSPRLPDADAMLDACTFANRTLGFVNAPALWQLVLAEVPCACVDVAAYERKRNTLCDALARMGYEVRKPEGGYYVFPRTPIPDDIAFVGMLLKEGVLAVPGAGFGRSGYIRLSITTAIETIERSLPAFEKALRAAKG